MLNRIIPALIAKNQKELNERIKKVGKHTRVFHLDIMDGKFVKNKSLDFDFKLPKKFSYGAHLMVKDPKKYIEKHWKRLSKVRTIIFHYEACKKEDQILELIDFLKKKGKKPGMAINPRTGVGKIRPFVDKLGIVIVMTVTPGKYGAKFLPAPLTGVTSLRRHYPKLVVEVDGGMNDRTIGKASRAGANQFIVGSYLQDSDDVVESLMELKSRV